MGALAATQPSRLGTTTAGGSVAATDTIASAVLGVRGAFLEIINGNASGDNITISDAGTTPAGTPGGTYAVTVPAGTSKVLFVHPRQADPVTALVTITHSVTTTVTYKLYPLG